MKGLPVPYADIRTRIKAILLGVDGIEIVHEYDRFIANWEKFLELFKNSDERISGWTISRRSVDTARHHSPVVERSHDVRLRGFHGLNDAAASELVFQSVVDGVLDAIDRDRTLGKTVQESGPARVEIIENRMFGKVLCHYADIIVPVLEYKTVK